MKNGVMTDPDMRTPLDVHRAAFARVAGRFVMSATALEELRRIYQAAERNGDPRREREAVLDVLSRHNWDWPWLESSALAMEKAGVWPLAWRQIGLLGQQGWAPGDETSEPDDPTQITRRWNALPLAPRVDTVLATLRTAVSTEKALLRWREVTPDEHRMFRYTLELQFDDRCPASEHFAAICERRIASGDLSRLPPFFPGDTSWLRVNFYTSGDLRRRTARAAGPAKQTGETAVSTDGARPQDKAVPQARSSAFVTLGRIIAVILLIPVIVICAAIFATVILKIIGAI